MYMIPRINKTSLRVRNAQEGETIEQKIDRITTNNEPITDGAPIIYTDRKDGVEPAYDIRTDRFELAVEAMDRVAKTKLAKRAELLEEREKAKVVPMNEQQETKGGTAEP